MLDNLDKINGWENIDLFNDGSSYQIFQSVSKSNSDNICNGIIEQDINTKYNDYIFIISTNSDISLGIKDILDQLHNINFIPKQIMYNKKTYKFEDNNVPMEHICDLIKSGQVNIIYKVGQLKVLTQNSNHYYYLEYALEFNEKN